MSDLSYAHYRALMEQSGRGVSPLATLALWTELGEAHQRDLIAQLEQEVTLARLANRPDTCTDHW